MFMFIEILLILTSIQCWYWQIYFLIFFWLEHVVWSYSPLITSTLSLFPVILLFSYPLFNTTDCCFHVIYVMIHAHGLHMYKSVGSTNKRNLSICFSETGWFWLYVDGQLHPYSRKVILTLLVFNVILCE